MRSQEAVDSFRDVLHLAPGEAEIYVHLCLTGPAKAGDLAGALKLHRNEVYRRATRLLGRGLVEMTMERPARFAAVSPEVVFEDEMRARLAAVEELKLARTRIVPLIHHLETPAPTERRSVYKVVQGRPEIAAVQEHMLEHARESVVWATTFPAGIPLAGLTGGLETLTRRLDAGIRLRALVRTTPRGWSLLEEVQKRKTAEVREADLESDVRFLIIDNEELLMWVVNDPSESLKSKDEVAIQTTAAGFVQAESVFFDQVWNKAPARS